MEKMLLKLGIGAEAIREILIKLDLKAEKDKLRSTIKRS